MVTIWALVQSLFGMRLSSYPFTTPPANAQWNSRYLIAFLLVRGTPACRRIRNQGAAVGVQRDDDIPVKAVFQSSIIARADVPRCVFV